MRRENSPTVKPVRDANIQMLRGICALVVFFSHSLNFFPIPLVEWLTHTPMHLFYDGQCAVMLFFVLGGYYYYKQTEMTMRTYGKGVWRKVMRIYPPHLIALALGILAIVLFQHADTTYAYSQLTDWARTFWHDELTMEGIGQNALLVRATLTDLINPPIWYLVVESHMILVLPLLLWFGQRTSYAWLCLLMIPAAFTQIPFLPYLFPYLMGVMLHLHIRRIRLGGRWMRVLIMLSGLFLLDLYNIFPLDDIPMWLDYLVLALQSVGAAMVILCVKGDVAEKKDAAREGVKRHLAGRCLVGMGNISYEFYVMHFILLMSVSLLVPVAYVAIPLSLLLSLVSATFMIKVKACLPHRR